MKSAKQMFEDQGYWLEENDYFSHGDIIYRGFGIGKHKVSQDICFKLKDKIITAICAIGVIEIDMSDLKAIIKQCEELGWLE